MKETQMRMKFSENLFNLTNLINLPANDSMIEKLSIKNIYI